MRNAPWHLIALALLGLSMPACSTEPAHNNLAAENLAISAEAINADELAATNAAWREERHASLNKPGSWLSLVGLDWLSEGENTVGSAPDSDVVLPDSLPAHLGVINWVGDQVRLETIAGVEVQVGDEVITSIELVPDISGKPTEVTLGSVLFYLIERDDLKGIRIKDSAAETLQNFRGLDYYPTNSTWVVSATLKPYDPPKMVPIPNVLGQMTDAPSPGALEFQVGEETYQLDALEDTDGSLSLIFGDATNGTETYGAGRFLSTAAPDENGRVMIDFNQAYNPPCAFTPYATCPLPPSQNKLAVAIEAGEKNFVDGHH